MNKWNSCPTFLIKFCVLLYLIPSISPSSFEVLSSEVFIIPLNHVNFDLPSPGVQYRPSLLNMPDLPSWLHYTYSPAVHSGFIYGAPPSATQDFKIEVIATDEHTYNISQRTYDVNIKKQEPKPNEVRFKVTNLNIDELLVGSRWDKLRSVLVDDLWPESAHDGAITLLSSATHQGDKLPMNPNDKEGIYIGYGSSAPFSFDLLELQMEVKPLWNHRPCPKYFKKASCERFFREKGFAIDWCNFKLQENDNPSKVPEPKERNAAMKSTIKHPPVSLFKKSDVFSRSYIFDVIYMILIPLLVMVALLGLLTLAMCCHRTNMDLQSSVFFDEVFNDFPKMPTTQDLQMVHYAGINKAAGALRTIKNSKFEGGRDHSPHPSMATTTTHVDTGTLPRSQTASPNSTLQRQSTPSRRFEDYATLTRPNPPPYQRNGSTTPTRLV